MDLRVVGKRHATLRILGLACVVISAAAAGCGGGGSQNNYPEASVSFDARTDTVVDAGADSGTRPPPMPVAGNQLLLPGEALLVGTGQDSCTNQDPTSGDRWCAFALPSTFVGATDLWVINITKALGGKAIRCDASDLDCLRLTSTLDTTDLTRHSFFGDTLIYYADPGASGEIAYGWRPGMTAGRRLTSTSGLQCLGQAKSDSVLCFQNLDTTTVVGQTSVGLVAGKLSVGGNGPLPAVASILVGVSTDPANTRKYQVGFSPAGDWVAWSARPTAAGFETLNTQKLNDDTTRVVVAEDVSRWSVAPDGASWYWLKSFNYDTTTSPLGTLQAATFPPDSGGAPATVTTLRPNVAFFGPAGDTGLLFFGPVTNGAADLSLMGDRGQPTQFKTIDTRVIQVVNLSNNGRTVVYSKSVATDANGFNYFDLYAGGLDMTSVCTLTGTANSPPPLATLSDPATDVFWEMLDQTANEFVGNYTDLATCTTHKFASDVWLWTPVKNQGVVFGDGFNGTTLADVDVTLRYAAFAAGALPATGTVIQGRANPTFDVMLPSLSAVVFTINAGGAADGLYVKSDLPFATTP